MEHIVLGLLLLKEMTIYELNTAFSHGLSLIYSASYGNLQYAVKKLLKAELIEYRETVENGRNKKIYSIRPDGRRVFFEWMESEIPVGKLETVMLSKVYFLGLVDDPKLRLTIVEEMIMKTAEAEEGLRELNSEVRSYRLPEEHKQIAGFQFKTLDYGLMAHSAGRQWLQKLYNEVKDDGGN